LGPSDWNVCSSSLLQTRNNVEERFMPILIVLPWAFHNPYIPWGGLSLGEREREREREIANKSEIVWVYM
jgi:hypothetical protein